MKHAALLALLALSGCASSAERAAVDRPLLSIETRLACAADNSPAEAAPRGPSRPYDGDSFPSVPAPSSADPVTGGVTPRRSCDAGEAVGPMMLALPVVDATVDGNGALSLVEAEEQTAGAGTRRASALPPPPPPPPPPVNRAAEAATRAAAAAQARVRPPR